MILPSTLKALQTKIQTCKPKTIYGKDDVWSKVDALSNKQWDPKAMIDEPIQGSQFQHDELLWS